ncbi:MAG: DUF4867 family protein [Spirochaetes bacterium]|nr:DUF4867 family protein [Spirochaetota bacterium]
MHAPVDHESPAFGRFRAANSHLKVFNSASASLTRYGQPVSLPAADLAALLAAADAAVPRDPADLTYVAGVKELETGSWMNVVQAAYGQADLQVGWCASRNSTLNGLEYHASPELIVALTDLALLLGLPDDIDEQMHYAGSKLECLFLQAGEAVLLKPRILHFSPCRTTDAPFRSLIILPRGTNTPLEEGAAAGETAVPGPDRLLFMKNKWLLAHPEREPLMKRGAWPGIDGPNIEVRIT